MNAAGVTILVIFLLLLAAAAGWVIFTRIRAQKLGVSPPPITTASVPLRPSVCLPRLCAGERSGLRTIIGPLPSPLQHYHAPNSPNSSLPWRLVLSFPLLNSTQYPDKQPTCMHITNSFSDL